MRVTSGKKKFKACAICSALRPVRTTEGDSSSDDDRRNVPRGACSNCKSVNSFTTNFKGLIAVTNEGGWVEKWQRLNKTGLYGMIIDRAPDEDDLAEYEQTGETYFDRTKSFKM